MMIENHKIFWAQSSLDDTSLGERTTALTLNEFWCSGEASPTVCSIIGCPINQRPRCPSISVLLEGFHEQPDVSPSDFEWHASFFNFLDLYISYPFNDCEAMLRGHILRNSNMLRSGIIFFLDSVPELSKMDNVKSCHMD